MRNPDASRQRHLLHVFSTFGIGGPQVRFAALANALGSGARHTVIAMDGDYACAERIDEAVPMELAPMPVVKGGGLSIANLRRFRQTIRAVRPDLLLTYNWGAIEWALANRVRPACRHVHFEDGFGPDEADGQQLAQRVWMRRLALSGRTEIVVPSHLLERIARERWRFSAGRVRYIPNGVDCARFGTRSGSRSAFGLPVAGPLIGSVGALRPEKNFGLLIRAFAQMRSQEAQLVLVGDGPERGSLEALARELGVGGRVYFAGRMEQPEQILGHLDLFALSSDTEQMPISLIEAMAADLAVVATDVGDVRTMVAEGNRPFVTPVGDEASLSRSMARLLDEPETRQRVGAANRAKAAREYSLDKMVESYAGLFGV